MNDQLLEELLNEDEGSALDFKRDQYPFSGATDEQKSELLKDILSFANAWRRTDAFILIGVEDVRGGRSKVVGITTHLDESSIQQFVNGRTQRPVDFSYQAYPVDGVQIAVIRVPKQARPLYSKSDYGKVRKEYVYLRRGSATDIADPDEIARMGLDEREARAQPSLRLELANFADRTKLGLRSSVESSVIVWPPPHKLPNYGQSIHIIDNRDYFRELAEYVRVVELVKPLGLAVTNESSIPARDAQVQIVCERADELFVCVASEYPSLPSQTNLRAPFTQARTWTWDVVRHGHSWTLRARVGTIQPKETWWSPEPFYVGGHSSDSNDLQARVFADNLSEPVPFELNVEVSAERHEYGVERLLDYLPATD